MDGITSRSVSGPATSPTARVETSTVGRAAQPSTTSEQADTYSGSVVGPDPGLYRKSPLGRHSGEQPDPQTSQGVVVGGTPYRDRADSAGNAGAPTGTQKVADKPVQGAAVQQAPRSKDELARRTAIMRGMIEEDTSTTLDGKPDPKLVAQHEKVMQQAMDAFPLRDLEAMGKAGVKIKFQHPPEGASAEPGGSYVPDNTSWDLKDPNAPRQLKHSATIYVDPRVGDFPDKFDEAVNTARHELAHAKDDFDHPDRLKSTGNHHYEVEDMASKSGAKVYTDGKNKSWSVQDMYNAFSSTYKKDKNNNYIASKGTDHAHSADNAQEFFAEGYNVFHGNDPGEWARLKRVAPQLYAYLHQQATAEGTLPAGIPAP